MPVIVTFSARVQRRHLENSYLGTVVVVVGPSDWVGRVQRPPTHFAYNTSAIACLKTWDLLRGFNWHQGETIHLVQCTHFADGKTQAPRGEGMCLPAPFGMTPELFSKHPWKGALKVQNEQTRSSLRETKFDLALHFGKFEKNHFCLLKSFKPGS